MRFKLFNHEVDVENVNYEESIVSYNTGKELEKIYFELDIKGRSMNDSIQSEISSSKDGGIFSLDENGDSVKEYRLIKSPYKYSGYSTDESTVYSYNLYLEEVERLNVKSLLIGDLEIFPYEYEEEYDDAVIITTKVKLTKDESERLDNIDNDNIYFDVVRKGISDKKLEMRFGKIFWSEDEDIIKKELILVEKVYDENTQPQRMFSQVEMGNIMRELAYVGNLNNELIDLLISKEIATSEEIELIKEKAEADIKKARRKFYRVKDINKF